MGQAPVSNFLPEGTKISCPKCAIIIAELIDDLYKDQVIDPDKFAAISVEQEDIKRGKPMVCPRCKEPYAKFNGRGLLHTTMGWK